MSFGSRLRDKRKELGITQPQLATMLGVSQSAIGSWETDVNSPRATLLYDLFDILHCDANYLFQDETKELYKDNSSPEEFEKIIKKYRDLDDHGRDIVDAILNKEHERVKKYGKLSDNNKIITLMEIQSRRDPALLLPYWENGVSAGNGIYQLNDTASVMLSLWATELTKQADFIIKVSGSSMEPDFHDGDKVLVNRKVNVEVGEVGIFVKNGETYIKELGNGELISRNSEYPNIQVNDYDNVVCLGKVIGTLRDEMIAKD